jgi:diguanylate cyclase (GGDEF)-like protein
MPRFVHSQAFALAVEPGRLRFKGIEPGDTPVGLAGRSWSVQQNTDGASLTNERASEAVLSSEPKRQQHNTKAVMPFLSGIHIAVLLLLLTIAVGMYADFKSEQMNGRHLQIQTGLERMVRLNQSLTGVMATAVIEKNILRAASYNDLNTQLESTMQEVQALTQPMALAGEILALHDEQRALREQESQVFSLMREEKWDAAYQAVLSGDYVMALKVYEINSGTAVGALIQELSNQTRHQDQLRQVTLVLRMVAVFLLLWAGWRYSRRLKAELAEQLRLRWQVSTINEELEEKVRQRTTELQAANKQLEILSTTDALTGLANRRRFDRYWADEWQRALRQATPLAVIMLDVDHFKAYNDHYGHPQGDVCLRRVGAVLQSTVRRGGELAARYGGEEFVVVLPGVTRQQAQETARAILNAICAAQMPHACSPVATMVTVSLGVAVGVPGATDERDHLLKMADVALYAAKNKGRNRVVLAD